MNATYREAIEVLDLLDSDVHLSDLTWRQRIAFALALEHFPVPGSLSNRGLRHALEQAIEEEIAA